MYLILVIFKLPVIFHGGRGEEIEEGVCLHLKPDKVSFNKIGSKLLKVKRWWWYSHANKNKTIRTNLFGNFLGGNATFPLLPAESFHLILL